MSVSSLPSPAEREISTERRRRRTFAIISHPDAGKTTLTEKLLLYSGLLRTAGMVRARKGGKSTSSDWMTLEQERGISISASAMQFPYKAAVINLLDTPGHQDFSEDTYRTLHAADSAVMVLDSSKGVETQTRKLFAVCSRRGIPVITFINKMDLPARDPFDLMAEVEGVLGIHASPLNWPIGAGKEFCGVVDIRTKNALIFERSEKGGALKADIRSVPFAELKPEQLSNPDLLEKVRGELELLAGAGNDYSHEKFLAGKITPVFFGSAMTNFGIEPFFDGMVEVAACPGPVSVIKKDGERGVIDPDEQPFSGFVFKVQSNMNPRHRDSMAFIRICSGKLERDMMVFHERLGKEVRLSRAYSMFARDKDTVETAYPGDVVGLANPGMFLIGDTISAERISFKFPPLPQFAPELVARIRPKDVMKKKQFDKGIEQLALEGTVHLMLPFKGEADSTAPMVAAVGKLQFEVAQYRLEDEYKVPTDLSMLPYQHCAYLEGDAGNFSLTQTSTLVRDSSGRPLVLYGAAWEKDYLLKNNPKHRLVDIASKV